MPADPLVKVIRQRPQLSSVEAVRGWNGGVRLARAPESIVVGEADLTRGRRRRRDLLAD